MRNMRRARAHAYAGGPTKARMDPNAMPCLPMQVQHAHACSLQCNPFLPPPLFMQRQQRHGRQGRRSHATPPPPPTPHPPSPDAAPFAHPSTPSPLREVDVSLFLVHTQHHDWLLAANLVVVGTVRDAHSTGVAGQGRRTADGANPCAPGREATPRLPSRPAAPCRLGHAP